jgi:hypothetical protein
LFILEGEPATQNADKFIPVPVSLFYADPFGDSQDDKPVEVSALQLLNLANARSIGESISSILTDAFGYFQDSITRTYSLELAQRLPVGHPYRLTHGLRDSSENLINWLLDDPDLSSQTKVLVSGVLFDSDPISRASKWPELINLLQRSDFAWTEWRESLNAVLRSYMLPFDAVMDELHPREAGVLKSSSAGMSFTEIAEKFGVDEARIIGIYAEGLEKVRQSQVGLIAELQSAIDIRRVSSITELAGVIRETQNSRDFLFTKMLLRLCSGRLITGHHGAEIVLSEHAFNSARQL